MTDVVDKQTRSRMMSAVKGKNTAPELRVRRYLHKEGFRFRLHRNDLPGSPDLVLPKYHLVIFVHGCFWHQHPNCRYAAMPATHNRFWSKKLEDNSKRDLMQVDELINAGWRVLVVWECGLKHCNEQIDQILPFLTGDTSFMIWPNTPPKSV